MRHFNQAEIEELRRVLIGDGVRDSEFETVESFTDSDKVAIVQNGKNRKIDLSKLCSRISDLEKEYIDKQDTVTLEQSKSYTDNKIFAIPVASTDQFGLVQIGKNLTVKNGVLSVDEQITAEERKKIDGIRTYNGDGSTILRTDSAGNISTFRVGKISQSQVDGLESSFESTLKGVSVTGIPVNVSEDQVADIPLGASLAFSDRINLIWSLFQNGEVSVNNKSIFLQKVNSLPGSGLIAGGIYFDSRAHAICVATSDSEAEVYASGNIANAFLETSESGKKDILVLQYIDDSADLRIDLSQYAIRTDVDSSISDLKEVIKRIKSDVSIITAKIPEAATDTNKLADKDWVNSSIASNTATFRGTFETVADLPVADIKKNDYAFIIAEDTSGDPEYQRYKYDGESWVFEYTLNNSSFTSDQWKAINSGITADLVTQITTNKDGIAALNTSLSDEVERATTKEAELENEIAAKYTKPDDGIPASDLTSAVQTVLTNATTAYGWGNHAKAGYIPFNQSYIADTKSWTTTGYVKTRPGTLNLPEVCTGQDRWGVLFFASENGANGTYLYWPIDGTYKGRMFTRTHANGTYSAWYLIAQTNDIPTKLSELTDDVVAGNYLLVSDLPTKVSQFTNDAGYITSSGSVKHATSADTADTATNATNDSEGNKISATYATKSALEEAIESAGKVDDVQVNGTSVVTDKVAKIDLSNYYTKDESYSNTEIDTKLLDKANDKVTYKNVVDDKEVETTDTVSNWITNIVSSINSMGTGFEEVAKSVNTINSKIPAAATSENQLADKDWVNSSIASNTATFRGTFETVDNLPTDNIKDNDYAFVIATDDSGNPEYQRYKYSNGAWTFEYTLNNSSFTSDQWKAINSGITSDTLGTLINATTLSDELAKYLPLTGGTLTGTLNVPSISGVGSITLDEAGIINTTGTHIKVTANFPLFPNITVAQTNIARPILLQSPLDGAMNKSDSNFTYNGNTHILSVSNINTNTTTTAVAINTGTNANSYFQSRRFRGQGNASEYRHAIDFGYAGHDQVDFYEYGGVWNFWKNTGVDATSANSNMVASLRLGCLYERGNKLEYPGKSGTIALTSDIPTVPTKLSEFTDDVVSGNYLPIDGTAVKATADASGNVITDTYAIKTELREVITDAEKVEEATAGILCGIDERLDVLETSITAISAISDDEINTICV